MGSGDGLITHRTLLIEFHQIDILDLSTNSLFDLPGPAHRSKSSES